MVESGMDIPVPDAYVVHQGEAADGCWKTCGTCGHGDFGPFCIAAMATSRRK